MPSRFGSPAKRKLTTEEARKILENAAGYFEVLIKWD
jgi:hypothetical protein